MHDFEIGKLYNRQKDIHTKYGGSKQSGIATCKNSPYIFVFTGMHGEQYGYTDKLDDSGCFHYTGEGQIGDMTLQRGNKALRDQLADGREILLFRQLGKSKPYQFLGQFNCISYEYKEIPDKNKKMRQGIIFHLYDIATEEVSSLPSEAIKEATINKQESFEALREKAFSAAKSVPAANPKVGKRTYYERSQDVKDYVLARANGVCECCDQPAPFLRKDGSPYLEPHHIRKLSDSGLDHPLWVAAVTPNCHRHIHHGHDGDKINEQLKEKIIQKEKTLVK